MFMLMFYFSILSLQSSAAASGAAADEASEPEAAGAGAESTETECTRCSLITSGSFPHNTDQFIFCILLLLKGSLSQGLLSGSGGEGRSYFPVV